MPLLILQNILMLQGIFFILINFYLIHTSIMVISYSFRYVIVKIMDYLQEVY